MKKIKNPLRKRLPRELTGELGKYLVIFLFMTLTIGFVSGFLVAGGSMIEAYNDSFEKYNIEDGHFILADQADDALMERLEEEDIRIYPEFYLEETVHKDSDSDHDSTIRIYVNRTDINRVCLMKGEFPQQEDEIAVDRMYADNNGFEIGDRIQIGDREVTITGFVALSDYSALFSDNGDIMFDSIKFGVAVMTKEGFDGFSSPLHYSYSWKYNHAPADEIEEKEMADDLMQALYETAWITGFVPRYSNQAIQFTGEDLGSDKSLMIVLLYVLIVILAFVFSVTISHTIVKEAAVIGTLRASGYTRGEILRAYLAMPMLVTLLAALAGNILGYTVFKNLVVELYYESYSLPTYQTIWNGEAFVLTTVVPLILMLVTNVALLVKRLSLSPLRFLRHDLSKRKHKKALRLPNFKFFHRFRIRIVIQNASNFITLFVGIVFSSVLLMFGMMMSPLLSHYQDEIIDNMRSQYQYILKAPVEVSNEAAEKYCAASLRFLQDEEDDGEAISVYGITEDSIYFTEELPTEGVYISDGFAEKYQLKAGDSVTLREAYGTKDYVFKIMGTMEYPSGLSVFMTNGQFCDVFDLAEDYFNGYFSDEELTEIDENYILTKITQEDLTKLSRQLDVSMGEMFYLVNVFAVVLTALLIYLLTKLILERNASSISMVKILGYENSEIARLYLLATTWVVILSLILSMGISTWVMKWLFRFFMMDYTGWLSFYIEPVLYAEMFAMCMAAYVVVAVIQFKKIRKIPMDEALKNVE